MRLSPHFTLPELTKTDIIQYVDKNYVLATQEPIISNLRQLCQDLLEPIREMFNLPVIVKSGFRCQELNDCVGGSRFSQHMSGTAADFDIKGLEDRRMDVLKRVSRWGWEYPSKPKFRQLLIEKGCLHIGLPNGNHDGEVAYYDVPTKTKKIIRHGLT